MKSGIGIRDGADGRRDDLDLDSSVPDWMIEYPQLLPLFQELGLEYCCGGKSLRTASLEKFLNPHDISAQIALVVTPNKTSAQLNASTDLKGTCGSH